MPAGKLGPMDVAHPRSAARAGPAAVNGRAAPAQAGAHLGADTASVEAQLAERLGPLRARLRLGIETDHEAGLYRRAGIGLGRLQNWNIAPWLIRTCLRLACLYGRARRNAAAIHVRENTVALANLPAAFEGFTLLQISDPHVDMSPAVLEALRERVRGLDYDLCVLTGDYRGATRGGIEASLAGMRELLRELEGPVYGVLGNHDSIRMVPALEAMGVQMLINEAHAIERDGTTLHLAGIDDAHYFEVDDIAAAAATIPEEAPAILLSHTPEVYRQAARAGFGLLLCGHTHGGQLCLPGGHALTFDARIPRVLGRGSWIYGEMIGYTSTGAGASVTDVRLNCPAEVTLHRLTRP